MATGPPDTVVYATRLPALRQYVVRVSRPSSRSSRGPIGAPPAASAVVAKPRPASDDAASDGERRLSPIHI